MHIEKKTETVAHVNLDMQGILSTWLMTADSHEKQHGDIKTDAGSVKNTHKKEPTICRYAFDTFRYRYILQDLKQDLISVSDFTPFYHPPICYDSPVFRKEPAPTARSLQRGVPAGRKWASPWLINP